MNIVSTSVLSMVIARKNRPVSVVTSYTPLICTHRCVKYSTKPTSFSGEQVSQKMSIGYIQCKKCVLLMLKCLGEVTAI